MEHALTIAVPMFVSERYHRKIIRVTLAWLQEAAATAAVVAAIAGAAIVVLRAVGLM